MIWQDNFETVPDFRNTANEQMKKVIERALDYARNNLTDGYAKDDDDFVVITVEGYYCITLGQNQFIPLTINPRVFPFDNERIYPMQEIEQKIYFKQY